jgi:large subunit ribosomal protein L29
MTKATELREKSNEELNSLLNEKLSNIYHIRNKIAINDKEAKPSQVRAERKDVARIKTIQRQRQIKGT